MFGGNEEGQLGIGFHDSMNNVTHPTKIKIDAQFKQVALGYRHTLLLSRDDVVYGAGLNRNSELG
jgi:alpha-tubulin suppressor-like RCC1 family protein